MAGQRYRPIFKPAGFNSTSSEQPQNWQQHVRSAGLIDQNLAYPLNEELFAASCDVPAARKAGKKYLEECMNNEDDRDRNIEQHHLLR